MFPEPTELLLIGCSIESNLDPKIQIKYIERRDLLRTLTHQITQSGILTKISLLKEWTSDAVMEVRTVRLVNEQPPGLFTQHTNKFIVDDDDMDSNTVTESDMSLKSRSFLHRVNDRVRKMLDQSSKDATQDSNKHS